MNQNQCFIWSLLLGLSLFSGWALHAQQANDVTQSEVAQPVITLVTSASVGDYIMLTAEGEGDIEFVGAEPKFGGMAKVVSNTIQIKGQVTKLDCSNGQITSLDFSETTCVKQLWCNNNTLSALDVRAQADLQILYCIGCGLSSLDVTSNALLEELDCSQNSLTSLDVRSNGQLNRLLAYHNQLTTVDISNNPLLLGVDVSENQLTALTVTNNRLLETIYCNGNKMTAVAMEQLVNSLPDRNDRDVACHLFAIDTKNSLEENVVQKSQVAAAMTKNWQTLDYSAGDNDGYGLPYEGSEPTPKPELAFSYVADGSVAVQSFTVRTIDAAARVMVEFPDGVVAEAISADDNRMAKFAHRIEGVEAPWTIKVYTEAVESFASQSTGISSIDLSHCAMLKRLTLPYQNLTTVDLTMVGNLEELYLHGGDKLQTLDLSAVGNLRMLNLSNTGDLVVDGVESCSALTHLYAYNSHLTNLDLSQLVNLEVLDLTNTQTTAIDLSTCKMLKEVELTDNQLTTLDVSALTQLTKFKVGSNLLTDLDLTAMDQLEELDVNGNQLTELKLNYTSLTSLDCGKNLLSLGDLPARGNLSTYIYWPQGAIPMPREVVINTPLDLSKEAKVQGIVSDERSTYFYLYDKESNMLEEGTDYTVENGVFTFLKAQDEPVRMKLKNSAFPKFKGKYTLYTDYFNVVAEPTSQISFTTNKEVGGWLGIKCKTVDGSEVSVEGATYDSESGGVLYYQVVDQTITVRGRIFIIDLANNGLTSVDLTQANDLEVAALDDNLLTEVKLAAGNKVRELYLGKNSELASLDLSLLPHLEMLSCYGTAMTSFDFSANPELRELICRGQAINGVLDLSNNAKIEQLSCYDCGLTEIKLGANHLRHIECERNQIKGEAMTAFMEALPMFKAYSSDEWDDYMGYNLQGLYIYDPTEAEQNVCYQSDVKIATDKEWPVYMMNADMYGEEKPEPYEGEVNPNALGEVAVVALAVYPNPASDRLVVSAEGLGGMEVLIQDLNGRTCYRAVAEGDRLTVDVHDYADGIYIVRVGGHCYRVMVAR